MATILRLFIAGKADSSLAALRNFSELLRNQRLRQCRFEIIDVLGCPEVAERENIIVTPTLVAMAPQQGERRFIGDLSEVEAILTSGCA